jgi:hypothetical protein
VQVEQHIGVAEESALINVCINRAYSSFGVESKPKPIHVVMEEGNLRIVGSD